MPPPLRFQRALAKIREDIRHKKIEDERPASVYYMPRDLFGHLDVGKQYGRRLSVYKSPYEVPFRHDQKLVLKQPWVGLGPEYLSNMDEKHTAGASSAYVVPLKPVLDRDG